MLTKQSSVRTNGVPYIQHGLFFFIATLFSDIPRVTFNGTTDEIETIKQKFGDFLRKVVAETSSRGHDQDDRYS